MKSKYNKNENTLREQPEIPRRKGDKDEDHQRYLRDLKRYAEEKENARVIPCSENNWKDGQELEEGKDYVVRFQTDVNIAEDLVAVPIVAQETEDELWDEAIVLFSQTMNMPEEDFGGWTIGLANLKSKFTIKRKL